MSNLRLWQQRLFYLLLFLLPANLAYHLPIASAYVSGILVDYLIPTLYLTDIIILLLLILWLLEKILTPKNPVLLTQPAKPKLLSPFLIFLILLIPSLIFSHSLSPAIFKYFKYLEFTLLALWIKHHLNLDRHLHTIINLLSASVLFQSLLALAQWFKQSSIFGFWFLGEQPYSSITPSLDQITWFNGSLRIPPLATFSHPNVLAGFLAVIIPLLIYQISLSTKKLFLNPLTYILIPAFATLFLTFSLSAWLALLLIGLPGLILILPARLSLSRRRSQQLTLLKDLPRFQTWQQHLSTHENPQTEKAIPTRRYISPPVILKLSLFYTCILILLFLTAKHLTFLAPQSSFTRRSQLTQIALDMLKYRPLTGVGLNNFTPVMDQYGYITATTRFLQPVHNIDLLFLAETGLLGYLGFAVLTLTPFYLWFKQKKTSPHFPIILLSYCLILFLGLFDHYPLTLQQGSLLFFALLGLVL